MTPEQLDQAAAQLAAAISHLEPEETTPEALAADDAAFPPALVDGIEKTAWADGRKIPTGKGGE